MNEDKVIELRKDKLLSFIKEKYLWFSYIFLAVIVFFAVKIRTLNLPGLKDVTTGTWTLGPDLDPFLFLRWAKYIVEHGYLFAVDTMRYSPIGFDVSNEVVLHPYLIAWFHKLASFFGSVSVEQSAVLYPVFMFALTVIAFFFLVRKMFYDELGPLYSNLIALLSSIFLTVIPSFLPRTIAGIPEKEASGFLFLFLALYFFISSWKAENIKFRTIHAVLAAVSTALMAFVWGGYTYIYLTIALGTFIAFVLGKVKKNEFISYAIWLILSIIIIGSLSGRYSFSVLFSSTTTLIPISLLLLIVFHYIIFSTRIKRYLEHDKLANIPKPVISIALAVILGIILALIVLGPAFIKDKFADITKPLITPISDRVGVTVAENKQPYFIEWQGSFGPSAYDAIANTPLVKILTSLITQGVANFLSSIPIIFWLFFIGSICLYSFLLRFFDRKARLISTLSYLFFLFALIFSRYSSSSKLNGTNTFSILLYLIGVASLVLVFGYYYYQYSKKNEQDRFTKIDMGLILLFSLFFFSIVSARGAVRLIMVLVPAASILASYLLFVTINFFRNSRKTGKYKIISCVLLIIVLFSLLSSAFILYEQSKATARSYVPSSYTVQWQKAMGWVRENTPENSVFAHWWDYGYWLQSIGERATVLDGGNSIPYWNYLMGRYALTGSSSREAVDFLYSHNATHLLIDSTDIGKYPAFSSIGSDGNYDRYSQLSIFQKDSRQTKETKNSTQSFYFYGLSSNGGYYVVPNDFDVFYELNGTKLSLPSGKTGVLGFIVDKDTNGKLAKQPQVILANKQNQYVLPLRYAYDSVFRDFGSGIEAGIFLMPSVSISQDGASYNIDKDGALIYLSSKTVKSQLARLYLYKETDPYFTLSHTEDDLFIADLKAKTGVTSDFAYYQGLRGPIRIWQINYPSDVKVNPEYLKTEYPDINLTIAKK